MANLKDAIDDIEKMKKDIKELCDEKFYSCDADTKEHTKYLMSKYFKMVSNRLDKLSKDLNKIRNDLLPIQNINI